jgi:hypothetical protein
MPSPGAPATCHTQQLIDQLPEPVQFSLNRALAASWVSTSDLLEVLGAHGLDARAENVNRHRRRLTGGNYACKCPLPDGVTP